MRADAEQRERRQTIGYDSLAEWTLCRGGIRIGAYRLVSLHYALRAYHIIGLFAQRKLAQRLLFLRLHNNIALSKIWWADGIELSLAVGLILQASSRAPA